MAIPVIIPVFNRPEYTEACLGALYSTRHGAGIEPVVVDNGSRARTKKVISDWEAAWSDGGEVARPRVLTLPENRGFAGGANAGLRAVLPREHVVVMHNDCVPFDGWAGEMLACMEEDDDEHAVVVPMTNYANEHGMCVPEVRRRFEEVKPGNKVRVMPEELGAILAKTYPDGIEEHMKKAKEATPRFRYSVEVASFCMMTRGDLLERYGLFDEDFFPRMFEDKFWFQPLERDGYVTMIARRAWVHHFGNITSDGPGFNFAEIAKINEERFREKCYARDKERRPPSDV